MTAGKQLVIFIIALIVYAFFSPWMTISHALDVSFWLAVYWGVLKITDKVR